MGPYLPLDELLATQGDASSKRSMNTQGLVRHVLVLRGARASGRAPRGNMARQLLDAIPKAKKGSDADGASKLGALPQRRLLKRWRDEARMRLGATNKKPTRD